MNAKWYVVEVLLKCLSPPSPSGENGFNPVWNEGCEFDINNPDLALLRFAASDEDVFGDPNFIGQAVFPVPCLKTGYHSVPLKNTCNEELELATLLVHVDIRREADDDELYAAVRCVPVCRLLDLTSDYHVHRLSD